MGPVTYVSKNFLTYQNSIVYEDNQVLTKSTHCQNSYDSQSQKCIKSVHTCNGILFNRQVPEMPVFSAFYIHFPS